MNLMKPFFSFLLLAFSLTLPAIAVAGDEALIFSSDFSAAELPPEISPRHGTRWAIEDGVLVGQPATEEQQEKNKAAGTGHYGRSAVASVQSRFEDAIIEFEFRIEYGQKLVFVGNAPGRSHLFNVNLSPEEVSLMRFQDKKEPTDKKEFLANAPVRLPAGKWHKVKIVMEGETVTVSVNGKEILGASHERFGGSKHDPSFRTGGTVQLDNVSIRGL